MDWIIQKAVELGVAWIQPVICDRSVVRLSGERAARREAALAARGDRRVRAVRPQPHARGAPDAGLPELDRGAGGKRRAGCLSPGRAARPTQAPPDGELELLVGPRGRILGARARPARCSRGCVGVGLGPRVLRTETAPLAALAAIHALWGDFSPVVHRLEFARPCPRPPRSRPKPSSSGFAPPRPTSIAGAGRRSSSPSAARCSPTASSSSSPTTSTCW